MFCTVVAEFLLTSASRGPSALAEPFVKLGANTFLLKESESRWTKIVLITIWVDPLRDHSYIHTWEIGNAFISVRNPFPKPGFRLSNEHALPWGPIEVWTSFSVSLAALRSALHCIRDASCCYGDIDYVLVSSLSFVGCWAQQCPVGLSVSAMLMRRSLRVHASVDCTLEFQQRSNKPLIHG